MEKKEKSTSLRMPLELYEEIVRQADKAGINLSLFIRMVLERWVKEGYRLEITAKKP